VYRRKVSTKGGKMRRLLVLATVGALSALGVTAPAAAKGPSSASLTGPGLGGALPVRGEGEMGPGTPLGSLVQFGGFFPQVFGQVPDSTIRTRPAGDLGPRYRVTYRVPGPSGGVSRIVQDVFPYAKPSSVTYMPPGQRFWDGMRTHGGWFVSGARLKAALVASGLTESPSTSGESFPWAWTCAGGLALLFLLLLVLRRRSIAGLRVSRSHA
jgi:hypothetical protein